MIFLSGVFAGALSTILVLWVVWAIVTRDDDQDFERE